MADKRERGGSSREGGESKAAKTVGDGESILIVHTWYHLFVLDLKSKPRGDPIIDPPVPSPLKALDLVEKQLPTAMGVLRVGTDVFMFGGETTVEKIAPLTGNSVKVVDRTRGLYGMMDKVYKLNRSSFSLEPTNEVMPPAAPKCDPLVENINGKTFVLQGHLFFRGMKHLPVLEVFDPTDKCWNQVPDSLDLQELSMAFHRHGIFDASFIIGYRIYIAFRRPRRVFCFNTETGEWEKENAYNLRRSFKAARVHYPNRGRCVSGLDLKEGLNVVLSADQHLLYAYLIDDMGNLLCFQIMEEVYGDWRAEHIAGVEAASFIDTKTGPKCLVFTAERWPLLQPDSSVDYVVCISRFQITKLSAADGPFTSSPGEYLVTFLEIGGVTLQVCTLPSVGTCPFLAIREAFFL